MEIINQEVIDLINRGNTVEAIKLLRGDGKTYTLGVALKMVDDYINAHFPTKLIRMEFYV